MRLFLALIALLFAQPACAQEATGFRGMIWGVSKDDVRKFEEAKFYSEKGDSLYFLEKPNQFRRLITYNFLKDKLVSGKFEYVELDEANAKTIMDMFGNKQIEFDKIYGDAESQEFIWKDKKYLYYPQFWQRSLQSGDLRMRAVWQTADTRISLETYHDGMFYQLYYIAEAAAPGGAKKDGIVLDLPKAATDTTKQP